MNLGRAIVDAEGAGVAIAALFLAGMVRRPAQEQLDVGHGDVARQPPDKRRLDRVAERVPVVQRLAADGLSLTGAPTTLITNDRSWEGGLVEGPWMIDHDEKGSMETKKREGYF